MSFKVPQLGRLGQVYIKEEATYNTAVTFAPTDAVRHLGISLPWSPLGRKDAADRLLTPDQRRRYNGRQVASFDLTLGMWPSGTINTVPEANVVLKHGLGAQKSVTLSTTVAASPTPTATVFTVASVTGLAVNDPILVNATSGGRQIRWITAINTLALTVAPALSAAPATGDAVKGCVGYSPATNPASSLVIGHYLEALAGGASQTFNREQRGSVVDKLVFTFDGNQEPKMQITGPAATQVRPAQSRPGAFTTVGTAMPSGILGGLRVGAANYPFQKGSVTITNNMTVRNVDYGTSIAQNFYRKGKRMVEVSLDTYTEDETILYQYGETAAAQALVLQTGTTEGQIWAVYIPLAEFDVPTQSDPDTEAMWSFKGRGLGLAGNDDIFIAQA